MERGVHVGLVVTLAAAVVVAGCGRERREPAGAAGVPKRVVTLTPSATETVHALGATDRLVGVDDYSTYPPAVTSLPRVGSFLAPNLEAILRLDPDLVITDDVHGDLEAALRDAGIASVTADMHSLRDVRAALDEVGARIGRADAARAAVEAIDAAVEAAAARRRTPAPRVLVVIDRHAGGLAGMVAAGAGTWLDELLAILGARNALVDTGIRYPKISPEEILRADPDVILDASYVADPDRIAADWAAVGELRAVRDGRIVVLKEPYILAPSPRVARALADLSAALDGALPPRGTSGE